MIFENEDKKWIIPILGGLLFMGIAYIGDGYFDWYMIGIFMIGFLFGTCIELLRRVN